MKIHPPKIFWKKKFQDGKISETDFQKNILLNIFFQVRKFEPKSSQNPHLWILVGIVIFSQVKELFRFMSICIKIESVIKIFNKLIDIVFHYASCAIHFDTLSFIDPVHRTYSNTQQSREWRTRPIPAATQPIQLPPNVRLFLRS